MFSSPLLFGVRRKVIRQLNKAKYAFLEQRKEAYQRTRPHPSLGHHPSHPEVFKDSRLGKITLTPEEAWSTTTTSSTETPLNYGLSENISKFLQEIPHVSAQRPFLQSSPFVPPPEEELTRSLSDEAAKSAATNAILSLRNANTRQIRTENKLRAIKEFGKSTADTGSPAVQIATLTLRIRDLYAHTLRDPKDKQAKLKLGNLTHRRIRVFRTIRKNQPAHVYAQVLADCGLDARAIEEEVFMPK